MERQKQKQYWTYRVIGSIDNFIAILFLFGIIVSFMAAGFNTKLLFSLFIWLSVLLYTNLSAVFARHVMAKGNSLRYKLKEWIKVNAFVTIIYAVLVIGVICYGLIEKSYIEQISRATTVPLYLLHNVIFIFIGCMVLLIIHVLLTFHYLKQFNNHFRDPEDGQEGF